MPLNPLRARLVEDLKSLDKYPWTGHSAILGRRKNLLIPALEKEAPSAEDGLTLAEKTIEDVLRYFGETRKVAKRRYRQFVEKGIKHGRREDL
jgi:hypothetical protein